VAQAMLDGEAGVEEREAGRALGLVGAHHEQDRARDYEGDPERRPHSRGAPACSPGRRRRGAALILCVSRWTGRRHNLCRFLRVSLAFSRSSGMPLKRCFRYSSPRLPWLVDSLLRDVDGLRSGQARRSCPRSHPRSRVGSPVGSPDKVIVV